MKAPRIVVGVLLLAALTILPSAAIASAPNNESATYEWDLESPNVAMASSGDTIAVTGSGTFGVHPKFITGGGSFTHTVQGVGTFTGTWTATDLLAFQPYGCGVVHFPSGDVTIPPNFCGGRIDARVVLTAASGAQFGGVIQITCVIGSVPTGVADSTGPVEGVRLNVPGVDNFNKSVAGMNVFIKTS
ncbi:MAG: hypothetical protein M3R39_07955 [Actinomycetota bacterium]|nr:hypothetical protein [Actinomycetota bacterium]